MKSILYKLLSLILVFVLCMPVQAEKRKYAYPYALKTIGIDHIEDIHTDKELTVAVIDTGVSLGTFTMYFKKSRLSKKSINLITGEKGISSVYDGNAGHGTRVASIIAKGTPDNVSIMVIKISNTKEYSLDYIEKGIRYAIDNGADVINISSMGILNGSADAFTENNASSVFKEAEEKGIPIVCCAGNQGKYYSLDDETFCYPVGMRYSNIFGIGSLSISGNTLIRSSFSNQGYFVDYEVIGEHVRVPYFSSVAKNGAIHQRMGMCYDTGTSISAPIFTCAVCLTLLEYYKQGNKEANKDTIQAIDIVLKGSERDVGGIPLIDMTKVINNLREDTWR